MRSGPTASSCLIACVLRNDETIVPRGATVLRTGDRVLLVARPAAHAEALRQLTRSGRDVHA